MTCSVRELLSPYLAGELDNPTLEEVKHHLEACLTCRNELDLMVEIRHSLRQAAGSTKAPQLLRERAIGEIRQARRMVMTPRWNLAYGAALGALVFIAIILIFQYWPWRGDSFTTLSGVLARYHAAYDLGSRSVSVGSFRLKDAESWVDSQMGFKALIPNAAFAEYDLVGVDVFEHGGRKFAYLKYQHGGQTIGYVIFKDFGLSLDLSEFVSVGEIKLYLGKKKEINYGVWKKGGLVYLILTAENRSELIEYARQCIQLF
jgi:anti-sigma factor (TIGR02949 family)